MKTRVGGDSPDWDSAKAIAERALRWRSREDDRVLASAYLDVLRANEIAAKSYELMSERIGALEKALEWAWNSLLEGRSTIHELDCRRSHLGLDERPERECTCGYESARATKEKTA